MSLIVITGGIGTGKSAVLAAFAREGAVCLDTDEVAHSLYEPGAPAWHRILRHFGESILNKDGTIDRKAIARCVFGDMEELSWLNALMHPLIRQRLEEEQARISPQPLFAAVPLWFESGWEMRDVCVVSTWCTETQQWERLRLRGWSDAEINARLRSQLGRDEKLIRADFGLLTIGSLEQLQEQCRRVYKHLQPFCTKLKKPIPLEKFTQ